MAVAVDPQCAEAWNNLGVLYRAQGDVDAAARCYERALQAKPNFPQACNNLAVLHTAAGRARQAYSLLQAAVLADPTYSEAYNNLGVLLPELGMAGEAVEAYEQCLALCPDARNAGMLLMCLKCHDLPSDSSCAQVKTGCLPSTTCTLGSSQQWPTRTASGARRLRPASPPSPPPPPGSGLGCGWGTSPQTCLRTAFRTLPRRHCGTTTQRPWTCTCTAASSRCWLWNTACLLLYGCCLVCQTCHE